MKLDVDMRKKLDEMLERAEDVDLDIAYANKVLDFGDNWLEINEEEPVEGWFVSYGMADQVLGIVVYKDFVEVGIGECMRPYNQLYRGRVEDCAVDIFIGEVYKMIEYQKEWSV